ncbi:MAG: hypothetical protein M3004_09010 [Bacteroidota bacterium]|nr:hypothetical protein [Bacteroidota bacterium]
MRIGVISEGHADRAVISNILAGTIKIDFSDIMPLRPIYEKDETDKALFNPRTKSSYSVIKEECESKELIDGFLAVEGQDFIVIHIDTAEADRYGVIRPNKNEIKYCEKLRQKVIDQINFWLGDDYTSKILYAVAIEEIDAWVLTIYEDRDSTLVVDAKKKLNRILAKKGIKYNHNPFDYYVAISKPLSKKKDLDARNYMKNNCSLLLFIEEIKSKIVSV